MFARAHRGLPNRTFIDFAVAQHDDHTAVALLHANGKRHANTDRKSMAEGSGRSFNAGHLACFRMTAKDGVAAAKSIKRLDREKTLLREHDV